MNRRSFVSLGAGALASLYQSRPGFASSGGSETGSRTSARVEPMLYGSPRPDTDIDAWFSALQRWNVKNWVTMLNDYRDSATNGLDFRGPVVPLLSSAAPSFRGHIDAAEEQRKAAHILNQVRSCKQHEIDFWIGLPFPIFPTADMNVVRQCAPEYFSAGKFDLLNPRVPELLKQEIRALKSQIPDLKGVNLWMAEGAGSVDLTFDDLRHADAWQPPVLKAFDEVTAELGIGGILFAHEYLLTVGQRRAIYTRTAKFPKMIVEEDITWPEEDMLHPFLGYLPPQDRALLFRSNPVALNYLLDTEYIGQGVIPSVYPRWWKRNVSSAAEAGVKIAMGRTFFWDGGYTDVNFNRMNAHIFARLCQDSAADELSLLSEAAREMFGAATPTELIQILWETEPVIKSIVGINGIDPLSHSRYPLADYLDIVYTGSGDGMKAVTDLFDPPGTPLYPPLTDDLRNLKQWRWQNHTVSKDPAIYLRNKRVASAWVSATLPKIERLAASLSPAHQQLVVHGYRTLNILAKGMELFVEAAALHYRWAHAKDLDDGTARVQFAAVAARIEQVANAAQDNALNCKARMLAFAAFLRSRLPRIGQMPC